MSKARLAFAAIFSLSLAACAVGPDYKAPQTAPAVFHNAEAEAFTAANPEVEWWRQFEDPTLDELVQKALASNLDVRIALARVSEARALFTDSRLDQIPRVQVAGGSVQSKQQQPAFSDRRMENETYNLGFDATWELDLFGRVRRGVEAARADVGVARAELRDAQVVVAAEVARNYFELRGAQARLDVARRNLETQRETVRITQARFDVGGADPIDIESAVARMKATEATIPGFIAAERQASYRLAVLAGERPGAFDALLEPRSPRMTPFAKALPIGEAGDLLRRRPDVQAAERRLAGQTARVGVATADLFPRVRVTGFVGFLSGDLSSLGEGASNAWSVAPTVTWPGLDMVGARARLRAQEAREEASLAAYDRTVLQALEDVENALVRYGQRQAQLRSLTDQAAASRRAAELARVRYKEGVLDFLVLLDAERTLLAAEDAVASAETGVNTDVAAVYKALGGGWPAAS